MQLREWIGRAVRRITLKGQIRIQQPWMLAPGPLLLVLALVLTYRWMFFLAYTWLLLVGACYAWLRIVCRGVALQRTLHGSWAEVGDTLEESWRLTNTSLLPVLWLEIDDASTLPGYSARRVAAAGLRETQTWHTNARCTQRGLYSLGPLTARTGDPLGCFTAAWQIGTARQIVVFPPLVTLPPIPAPRSTHGGLAHADLLQIHATPSIGGLREYMPGDLPSRIHWPTVARTQRLMIKEFDQERAGAIWIVLDLFAGAYANARQRNTRAPAPQPETPSYTQSSLVPDGWERERMFDTPLELAVVLACSLAAQLLAEGRAVGLVAHDQRRRVITPDQGARQMWRILPELVDVSATGNMPLAHVLDPVRGVMPQLKGAGGLAVVTADQGGAWLATLAGWRERRREAPIVLLAHTPGNLPRDLLTQLARTGARTLTFETGMVLPFLHPPKPRVQERVSPLGRIQTFTS